MESMQFGDYVINLRRELHMHPELSMEESWTSQRICQELTRLGIPYEIVGEKNVIGILHGSKREGRTRRQTGRGRQRGGDRL